MPVSIIDTLTGKRWNYLTAPPQPLTFANYPEGLYTIINDTGAALAVLVWGITYNMTAGSKWDFTVHQGVHSVKTPTTTPPGIRRG